MAKTRNHRSTKSQKSSRTVETVDTRSPIAPSSMREPILEVAASPAREPLGVLAAQAPIAEATVDSTPDAPAPPVVEATPTLAPSHEQIARRAYELFLRRGHARANPLADWLEAERELGARAA